MANPYATATELRILSHIGDEPGGIYGLEIVRASGGKLSRGSVYTLLGRLEEKGFVKSRIVPDECGLRRPRYTLTGLGERAIAAARIMGLAHAGV